MDIRYEFFKDINLLIQKFYGNFRPDIYMQYSSFIVNECRNSGVKSVIIDFREITFLQFEDALGKNIDQITEQRRKLNKEEIKRPNIKHIFWVTDPFPTVIAQLFIQNFPDMEYHYCYTAEKVYTHLNLTKEHIDLIAVSKKLANSYTP